MASQASYEAGRDRRVVIYPAYLNAKKTRQEGRRVPAAAAAIEPNVPEIYDCVKHLKLPCDAEARPHYPRPPIPLLISERECLDGQLRESP